MKSRSGLGFGGVLGTVRQRAGILRDRELREDGGGVGTLWGSDKGWGSSSGQRGWGCKAKGRQRCPMPSPCAHGSQRAHPAEPRHGDRFYLLRSIPEQMPGESCSPAQVVKDVLEASLCLHISDAALHSYLFSLHTTAHQPKLSSPP